MDTNDIGLRLQAGMPIEIDGGFYHTPKLKKIINIGQNKYDQYLSALLFDKNNIDGEIDKDIDNFEVLFSICYHNEEFKKTFFEALCFVFQESPQLFSDNESLFFYFGDELDNWRIDKFNFSKIQKIVKISNSITIKKEDAYNPANKTAEKFIERIKAIKASRPKPKETMNLQSIMNGLSWRSNDINPFNILDLTIYQLYQGFFATEKNDNYQFTLQGVYAGTVDGKKINYNNIHWAKTENK